MDRDNRFSRLIWLILAALLLVGCADGRVSGTLIFEGTHQFDSETVLLGDLLMQAGTAEFAAGSRVDGSVYVVGGELIIGGTVAGDLVLLDGRVTLAPDALVQGDMRLGGAGAVQVAETAVVQGETITGLALPDTNPEGDGGSRLVRWLVGALLLAALGGMWPRRQRPLLHHISAAATSHWPVAGALGLLTLLVLPILLVMMAFTIVLLPLVLLLGIVTFFILGLGIVALGERLGRWLSAWANWSLAPGWATFGGTLLLLALFRLPWLGSGLFGGTAVLLFGAMLLSRFGTRAYKSPSYLAQPVDLASYARPERKAEG